MRNETTAVTVNPEVSDVELILFGYTGKCESFRVYYVIEVVIYAISIITNAITVTVLSCNSRLRILSNLFFACLAVTDLFQGFFGAAFNTIRLLWFSNEEDQSFVQLEGLLFLLVGWWLSTLFSYCSIMLISLERWFYIAHPFFHQRHYSIKSMFGAVATAAGICIGGCAVVTKGDAHSTNVGISFPLLHTCFSLLIVALYAHIIVISYRQQRSIIAFVRVTARRSTDQCEAPCGSSSLQNHTHNAKQVNALSNKTKTENSCLNEENNKSHAQNYSVFTIDPNNAIKGSSKHGAKINTIVLSAAPLANSPTPVDSTKHNSSSSRLPNTTQHDTSGKALNAHFNMSTRDNFHKVTEERKKPFKMLRKRTGKKREVKGAVSHNWKAVRMSATVFCMYFCFMSPWIYYEFITALIYGPRLETSETSQALNTLTCLHFCSNFFVYSFQNRDFRRVLEKYCSKIFGHCFPNLNNKVTDITHVNSHQF
ncbi:hypothetical protein ElyMa_003220500 [Elysia marginata]|uniref:G-protein coupled receptors family 1 profile domain-containing protein n=1 Tax=Elysia marginata TaxID=1093978 RepID=A0AAV4J1M2_9GAST|nr:hypothetical protein ElyMa_003220500 [Elysia marginata]